MNITRRTLLAAGAAAVFAGKPVRADAGGRYLSAAASFAGLYAVVAVGEDGEIAFDLDLADRGHGLAVRPGSSEAICFARRPGLLKSQSGRTSADTARKSCQRS